jgi:hypothetical protein
MSTDAEPEIRRSRRSLRRRRREWWSVRAWRQRWTWFLDLFRNLFRRRDRVEPPAGGRGCAVAQDRHDRRRHGSDRHGSARSDDPDERGQGRRQDGGPA